MNFRKAILLSLLVVSAYAQAQEQIKQPATKYEFTVQQCVDYAVKNNLQVKNAMLDYSIQEQTNRGFTSAAYPQLAANFGTTYFPNVAVQSFPNFIAAGTYGVLAAEGVKNRNGETIVPPGDFGVIQAQFGTKWTASGGVSLSQILFDGQVFVGLQARQTALDFSKKNIEVTEENIKANIYKVYYQLVVSKTQVAQLDANIEKVEKLLHDAGELFKNGFVEKIDVDRASVQLANLQTEKMKVLNTINNGYLGFKMLIGMPVQDELILTDKITEDKIKEDVLNDTAFQYKDRKEYQYLELGRKLNEYNYRRYKLSGLPTASFSGGFNKIAQRNDFSFFGKGDWFSSSSIGLNVNIPIFKGYANDANIKKAALELKQTDNQLATLKMSIDNDIAVATNNFHTAISTLDFQKKNMQLAEAVYAQAKKKYEIGTGSTTDITNAQTDLRIAESNYTSALYDAIIAKVDYLKATGKL
ncbi:MAG: TolC family protein [Panacibacter sp.]